MFRFEKEQQVWDFNGTKIGGQPGEYPTVLAPGCGNISAPDYRSQQVNIDPMAASAYIVGTRTVVETAGAYGYGVPPEVYSDATRAIRDMNAGLASYTHSTSANPISDAAVTGSYGRASTLLYESSRGAAQLATDRLTR